MDSYTDKFQKTLGQKDLVLFSVSAILLLDTLSAVASVGAPSLSWWIILGIIFYIPFTMICAEMGSTYPEQGGIYAWVRDAFGGRWASRATWGYWINTVVWIPAIFILFAGIFKQLFMPELSLTGQIALGVGLTWLTVFVNVVALDVGKWVPNLGATLKVVVFLALIISAFFYTQNHDMAQTINLQSLKPNWGSSLQYIPAIIYGMLGFELVSASSQEMKNPRRDFPRSILYSALIIFSLYFFATLAMLAVLPADEINVVEGLMDTLYLLFGDSTAGRLAAQILGIAALYTFFSNAVTWAMGCNRCAAEAAYEGELPKPFGLISEKRGTPVGAAVMLGVISSLCLILYGFLAGSNEDLFWTLFSFSAVIFLLPYIGMLFSFLKMRAIDSDRDRPYAVPGNPLIVRMLTYSCIAVLSLSIILFIYIPGEGMQWPVLAGVVITLLIGEVVIRVAEKGKHSK